MCPGHILAYGRFTEDLFNSVSQRNRIIGWDQDCACRLSCRGDAPGVGGDGRDACTQRFEQRDRRAFSAACERARGLDEQISDRQQRVPSRWTYGAWRVPGDSVLGGERA